MLPWIILFIPLFSAALITLVTSRLRKLSCAISIAAVLIAFLASCILFFRQAPSVPIRLTWIDLPGLQAPIGITIDLLSKTMLLVVTGIGALIHIYSLAYMEDDKGESRYFAALSLFMFSMLGIVFADNFVMMFIFWELVGVSSYLLIGHWFGKPSAADAAKKAFITNRIGDFGFMLGILLLWVATGSVGFTQIASAVHAHPAGLTVATLLIFCGTIGKSAQFPLHVWLPDAMEGPTPVSALIHAATMVAAGVYMLARVFFLIEASPVAQDVISWIGAGTALMAACIALQQNDIKRILAYSTLSQLGYMVMAIGVAGAAGPGAAMFHLFTHASFKALLFLGAGVIIYRLHHEQDIWSMGGLSKSMPLTFMTFVIGTAALVGFPGLSGFFSKDAILLAALERQPLLFAIGVLTAFLTAFYMSRLVAVVFLGRPRTDIARRGHDGPAVMTLPLVILSIPSLVAGYGFVRRHFIALPDEKTNWLVFSFATGAFLLGCISAFVLYVGKASDPIKIPLLANKFYIDEFYQALIAWTQDLLASTCAWFDRWIIDGAGVRGASGGAWVAGFVLRFFQLGNLQAYAFLFGLGVVALIWYVVF